MQNKKVFKTPLEGVGVVGYADVQWQVVPRLCSCDAQGALSELQSEFSELDSPTLWPNAEQFHGM